MADVFTVGHMSRAKGFVDVTCELLVLSKTKMTHPTFRAFVSLWAMICMLFAVTPLGCHSVNVRHAPGQVGRPYLPESTEERLQECGELVQKGIEPGRRAVDARVTLDENGRVLDATTTGEPNPA